MYGLLSSDESQALIARIKSDPQAARMYSEVRLQARSGGPSLPGRGFALGVQGRGGGQIRVAKPILPAAVQNTASHRGAWLAGIAATARGPVGRWLLAGRGPTSGCWPATTWRPTFWRNAHAGWADERNHAADVFRQHRRLANGWNSRHRPAAAGRSGRPGATSSDRANE